MNIEREARKAIQAELAPFEHLGACVTFRGDGDGRIKATVLYKGKPLPFYFPTSANRGPREIATIVEKTRAALVHLGVKRSGNFGEVLSQAILQKTPPPLPHEQEVLCPDAIAQETAEDEQEIQVMSTLTQPTNGANATPATEPRKGGKITDGLYRYHDGWDDVRVHGFLQTEASMAVFVKTRQEEFGKLQSELKVKKADRMEALEATVADLTRRLAALEGKRNG